MEKRIDGKGWFVYTISALASGNDPRDDRGYNKTTLSELDRVCRTLSDTGFARHSRRGWLTLEHPDLGCVQWKSGVDFRTARNYFLMRLNGKLIVKAWPRPGQKAACAEWTAGGAAEVPEGTQYDVETFLGSL